MQSSLCALVLASALFYASHIALSVEPVRGMIASRLGERGFLGFYSLVSLGLLGWMTWAFVHAPAIFVVGVPPALHLVPILAMAPAFVFLVCGYSQSNPTAIGQGPDRKVIGIVRVTRHPLMWALLLWAGSHVLVAGDAAGLIFFGSLAAFAIYGMARFDRKKRTSWGEAWTRFAAATSCLPFAAIVSGRNHFALEEIGYARLSLAALLYLALFAAHGMLGRPIGF